MPLLQVTGKNFRSCVHGNLSSCQKCQEYAARISRDAAPVLAAVIGRLVVKSRVRPDERELRDLADLAVRSSRALAQAVDAEVDRLYLAPQPQAVVEVKPVLPQS